MATTAFVHDHQPFGQRTLAVDGVERGYFEQLFWAGLAVNAYLPSTVFPTGLADDGLPIGLQALGGPFCDYETIGFTALLAERLGGFQAPSHYPIGAIKNGCARPLTRSDLARLGRQ